METILIIYELFNQYRNFKENRFPSERVVVVETRPERIYEKTKVSWYDRSACGSREYGKTCKTANGDIFNEDDLTVASMDLKLGSRVEFRNGDRSVVCRVNDRGNFRKYGRGFDLSRSCFASISDLSRGVIEVEYKINGDR